jgi:uncharacterized protein
LNNESRFVPLALALVVSTAVAAFAWVTVKLAHTTTIDVRGSAKKRIVSDLAEWAASVSAVKPTRVEASVALKKDVEQVNQFLKDNGVKPESIRPSAIEVVELTHEETTEDGTKVRRKIIADGWSATQRLEVASSDVERIERLSREATNLLEKGVVITSPAPSYLYTKYGELKIEMLAEASKDARVRAEKMLDSAGGGARVGKVMGIDTGVININPANSTETSWEGNFDTTSFEKDIITTVKVRFEVKN